MKFLHSSVCFGKGGHRMMLRHSLTSLRRTPGKTILFTFIIFALTVVLSLGTTLLYTTNALLQRCHDTYLTTAILEYQGGEYPKADRVDAAASALRADIDFDALAANSFVLDANPAAGVMARPDGYLNGRKHMAVPTLVLADITVTSVQEQEFDIGEDEPYRYRTYYCLVNQSLFATRIKENDTIQLQFEEIYDEQSGTYTQAYTAEKGHRYLICGTAPQDSGGIDAVFVSAFVNETAAAQGAVMTTPILDITDTGADPAAPEQKIFFDAAEAYQIINGAVRLVQAEDPAYLEEFSQAEYSVTDGSLYTSADCASGESLCLLPQFMAEKLNLGVGDTISLLALPTGTYPVADSYWPSAEDANYTLTYRICGIISTTSAESQPIFVSDLTKAGSRAGFTGYTLGTLHLENGTTDEQLALLQSQLPDGTVVTVYDQGYSIMHHALTELRGSALELMLLTVAVTLAVLVLFAFLFVGRQRETVQTMYMMGTPRRSVCLYLLVGTGLILLVAAALGSWAATLFGSRLNRLVSGAISAADSAALLYSNTNLGITLAPSAEVATPAWLLILCAASVVLAGAAICLAFLRRILRLPTKKKARPQPRRAKAPKEQKSSRISGAVKKYLLLSIRRGGVRTAVVPLICAVMALFLMAMGYALESYQAQRAALDKNTVISGYLTDYGGKSRSGLVVFHEFVQLLEDSDYLEDFGFTCADPYMLQDLLPQDGETTDFVPVEIPAGGFAYENFLSRVKSGARLVYTNDLLSAGEFAGETSVEITWSDGYDQSLFSATQDGVFPDLTLDKHSVRVGTGDGSEREMWVLPEDPRQLDCVVSTAFLAKHGVHLGDSVSLYVCVNGDLLVEQYRIVGSIAGVCAADDIFTSLPNATKIYSLLTGTGTQLSRILAACPRDSYSGVRFRLSDTSQLQQAKNHLKQTGFSRVHDAARYRAYPIFEDSAYLTSAEKLDSNIAYLQRVIPLAVVLVGLIGAAVAYLMTARRRAEIATLRSLGAYRRTVFAIIVGEQALLCLLGCGLGVLLWRLIAPWSAASLLSVVFSAGYLAGTVIAVICMLGSNLLSVLSEKE